MVSRVQYVFLTALVLFCSLQAVSADSDGRIDGEFFEIGAYTGILNIQDFNSEFLVGVVSTFKASEDLFLQFNYMQADTSASSFELSQGQIFSGADRKFSHYDFLLGYNLLQGEFFGSKENGAFSALYVVSGVGETDFGGESNFTLTVGLGYQFAIKRRFVARLDFRDHIFKSSLILEDEATHNTQITAGLSYLF